MKHKALIYVCKLCKECSLIETGMKAHLKMKHGVRKGGYVATKGEKGWQ